VNQSVVYFKKLNSSTVHEIQAISRDLLNHIIKEQKIKLSSEIPLKVHFGEKGNKTFIRPENYNGIIEFLKDKNIKSSFIETCVLYGGQRYKKELHLKTAREHGFDQLPIIIADGEHGEDFFEVEINQKHYTKCKLGKEFLKYNQMIIVAHFKGHLLAGFGGAIKQLSMGFASKGGKLAMHMNIKPKIKKNKCEQCKLCKTKCATNALNIGPKSYIDHNLCVGCGACVAICPHQAVSLFSIPGFLRALFWNNFPEKLAEYALAAQHGKNNIYINFLMNVTPGCDCEGRAMKSVVDDFGIFISTDPVAIDKACYDIVKSKGKKFRGHSIFNYAEKIKLGNLNYKLIEIGPIQSC